MLKKILFLLLICSQAFCFELTPMRADFRDSGKNTLKYFKLSNSSKKELEATVEMKQITFGNDRTEVHGATNNFEISPSKLNIAPGKSERIKVRYIGEKIQKEDIYRLVAKTRILNNSVDNNELAYSLEYVATVYVTPPRARADFKIENSFKLNGNIEVSFENRGTKRTRLKGYSVELSQGSKKRRINFRNREYKEFGLKNILVGRKEKIFIKDKKFLPGKVQARFIKNK